MSEMTDERAAEVLAAHNEWRRYNGETGEPGAPAMVDPAELGRAIDHVLSWLRSQPPAEAQPCGCGEATCTVPWEPGCGLGKSEQHAEAQAQGGGEVAGWVLGDAFVGAKFWTADTPPQGWTPVYRTAPPSTPVGLEWTVIVEGLRLADQFFDGDTNHWQWDDGEFFPADKVRTAYQAALAQQPASDGGFTAADMMDARQEGRKEAQQHAADSPSFTAVDMADAAAQGFRDGVASVGVVGVEAREECGP